MDDGQNAPRRVRPFPAPDLAFLEELEDRIDLEEARKAMGEGGDPIPFEKVRRELGLD